MTVQEFQVLVDDPSVEDVTLLPPLSELIDAGKDQTREGVAYLQHRRPKLFSAMVRLLRSAGLDWFPIPNPVDEGLQGPE